jgi:dimethylamine/trimethylamine dehydrogenase
MEVARIRKRIIRAGIAVETNTTLNRITADSVDTGCVFTGDERTFSADSVVLVTSRLPENRLFDELNARESEWAKADLRSVRAIGDAWAPSTIAAAVWAGHRYAEELDEPTSADVPFLREVTELSAQPGRLLPLAVESAHA